MTAETSVAQVLDGVVAGLGLAVEAVRITPAGRRRVVRVVVDRDLGDVEVVREPIDPLTLDDVAAATRAIESRLDESDVLGAAPYTLEVTSPGVSRPLTEPVHFQRNVGRLVRVVLTDGSTVTGRVLEADRAGVTLEIVATRREATRTVRLTHDTVARGEVQVEFTRGVETADETSDETPTPKDV